MVKLIELWLKAGVMEEMQVRKETTGTPQGGVISPLLGEPVSPLVGPIIGSAEDTASGSTMLTSSAMPMTS